MARIRVFNAGPMANNRYSLKTVSQVRQATKKLSVVRVPTGFSEQVTKKSQLQKKVIRGMTPPGIQPYNYPSPTD